MPEDICPFCYDSISRDEIFHEDDFFYARLDRFPGVPGHTEVIPKRHIQHLGDLRSGEKSQYLFSIEKVWNKIKKMDLRKEYENMVPVNDISKEFIDKQLKRSDLENISLINDSLHFVNNGIAAGQSVPHLHWHIIPAFPDTILPRGGRNAIIGNIDYTK